MESAQSEKVFFDTHGVKVTNARFVVSQQTYAMASVNSVKVGRTDKTPSSAGATGFILLGAFIAAPTLQNLREYWGFTVVGAVFLLAGIVWLKSIKPKFEYKLILTTSSGETTALTSFSEPDIRAVEDALNSAIIYRG